MKGNLFLKNMRLGKKIKINRKIVVFRQSKSYKKMDYGNRYNSKMSWLL